MAYKMNVYLQIQIEYVNTVSPFNEIKATVIKKVQPLQIYLKPSDTDSWLCSSPESLLHHIFFTHYLILSILPTYRSPEGALQSL